MEIKQLKYFLSISELGSFSRAAVMLSVTQPVLSRHIRSLEEELGTELLYRNGRGIVLTEAGTLLVDHAKAIMDTATKLTTEIKLMRSDPCGGLVIGLPPAAGAVLTVPLIQRFRETFPRVRLKVQEGYSGHVLEWLATGRIDVGVLYNAPKTSTLMTQSLTEEDVMLVGPPNTPEELRRGPLHASRLADLPLILPSQPHGLRILIETRLASVGIKPNVQFEIDSLHTCLDMVRSGAGYALLTHSSVYRQSLSGELVVVPVVEPRISGEFVLATSTQRPMTATTRALAKTVSMVVRDLVAEGVWIPKCVNTERPH